MSVHFARTLFVFRTPEIKESFDFQQCFHCSIGDEPVNDFVKALSHAREKMAVSLHSSNLNASSILADIDAYIPLLWQLLDSLDRQDPVKVETPLRFVWKGSVIRGYPKLDGIVYSDVIFDLIMSLHAKGLATANLAAEIAESDPSSVNSSAKLLREASAIMKFLASTLIPRWHTKLNYRYVPYEANSLYCDYLSEFFTACSNQMCVAKALQNSATPTTLLTSLCLSVVRGMESCLNCLTTSGLSLKDTDSGSRDHAGVMREFFSALVYKFQADTYMKQNETGIVIGLCAVVQARVHATSSTKYYDPFKPCEFPKEKTQSAELRAALLEIGESVAIMRRTAEDENKMVYFKRVPRDTSELPELPAPTVLNLPCSAYEPPQSKVIVFSYDPSRKKTIFNSFTKMFFSSTTPAGGKEEDEKVDEKAESSAAGPDVSGLQESVGAVTLERAESTGSNSNESALVDENSVKRLMDMGFMADVSRATLLKHNGNETAAINELLSS